MPRRVHISTRKRATLFRDNGGVCHLCGGKIGVCEAWDVSHPIPLEMGGADDESNWDTAHRKCHRAHTATVDAPAIAKAKRIEARYRGFKAPARKKIQSPGFAKAPPQRTATTPPIKIVPRRPYP